jgi:hypothetical protein
MSKYIRVSFVIEMDDDQPEAALRREMHEAINKVARKHSVDACDFYADRAGA